MPLRRLHGRQHRRLRPVKTLHEALEGVPELTEVDGVFLQARRLLDLPAGVATGVIALFGHRTHHVDVPRLLAVAFLLPRRELRQVPDEFVHVLVHLPMPDLVPIETVDHFAFRVRDAHQELRLVQEPAPVVVPLELLEALQVPRGIVPHEEVQTFPVLSRVPRQIPVVHGVGEALRPTVLRPLLDVALGPVNPKPESPERLRLVCHCVTRKACGRR